MKTFALRFLTRPHSAFRTPHSALGCRLRMERLEERTVLSSFAVSFGGNLDEYPRPSAIDSSGSSYLAGRFASQPADFDPGPGIANLSSAGVTDAFFAKYHSDGSYAWARRFGGLEMDEGVRTVVSSEATGDYVYALGSFRGTVDFGPGLGVWSSAGQNDIFVLKLDAATGNTVAGRQLGGTGVDNPTDVEVHGGHMFVTGDFEGTVDFDPDVTVNALDSANGRHFVWTLDTAGAFVSAWQLDAPIHSVAPEGGSLYLRGQYTGTVDFDPSANVESRTSVGSNNLWVAQYSLDGDFAWVQTVEISVQSTGKLAQDDTSLYVATTSSGDSFVVSFRKTDGAIQWSQRFGSAAGAEQSTTCVVNSDSEALYIGGFSNSPFVDFDPTSPGGEFYNQGNSDGFVLKLNSQTGDFEQVWQIGGNGATDFARVNGFQGSKIYVSSSFFGTTNFPSGQTITSSQWNDVYLLVLDETDALPPPPPTTKFYVVDDAIQNRTYEYAGGGVSVENYALNSGNTVPRGAASTAAGDKVWVVDSNKKVYVYSPSGALLGSWTAGTLSGSADVQGIATDGSDIWIVDAKGDKVYRYAGAASRLSGSQNAASSFALNSGNKDATDLVTDGTSIWVLNNTTTDKVFKYTVSGSLLGSWTINGIGGSPTGLTIDPANVSYLWIVDNSSDRVYQFNEGAARTSGSQSPSTSFPLAPGNTNPQGIADPPASSSGGASGSLSTGATYDSALLAVLADMDAISIGKKRK